MQDFKLDDEALRVIKPPLEGTPILRRRSEIEKTLALIVEAKALVERTTEHDAGVSGRISGIQAGILESMDEAIRWLGAFLHQRGPYIVIGFVQDDPDPEALPIRRDREKRQREENERLMEDDGAAAEPEPSGLTVV